MAYARERTNGAVASMLAGHGGVTARIASLGRRFAAEGFLEGLLWMLPGPAPGFLQLSIVVMFVAAVGASLFLVLNYP